MAGRRHAGKRSRRKLESSLAPVLPDVVPTRWVKLVAAFFLLPLAWVLTQTFFGVFAFFAIERALWLTEEFWFFALGAGIWMIVFLVLPKPLWVYVFGHELTHALWVWMMGGRVESWRVSSRGGHVLTDRVNTWIALAPYFFPIYSVLLLLVYWIAGLFADLEPWRRLLFAGIGMTWAFHFTFTCWMIPKGQSDLHYGGTFFSLVVIYLANLVVLSLLLVLGSPVVNWQVFLCEFLHNFADLVASAESLLRRLR